MNAYKYAAQEVAHIAAMLMELERLGPERAACQSTVVLLPAYWRTRIDTLLAASLPPDLEQRCRALLTRVDALCAPHGQAT